MHLRPMCRGRSSSCSCSGVLTHPRTVTPLAPDVAVERDGDRPADHDFHQVEVPLPVPVPAVVHPNRAGDVLRIPHTGDDALVDRARFQRGRCSRRNRPPPAARSSPTRYPVNGSAIAIPPEASTTPAATIPPAIPHAARMTVSVLLIGPTQLFHRSKPAKCCQLFLSVLCGINGRAPVLVHPSAGDLVRCDGVRPARHVARDLVDRNFARGVPCGSRQDHPGTRRSARRLRGG